MVQSAAGVGVAALLLLAVAACEPLKAADGLEPVPQIARDRWKDCQYNRLLIRCRDQQEDDQLRIVWIDGVRSSFQRLPPKRSGLPAYWGDRYGGLWRRELLPQGNTLLTHLGNGNRILVPLRFPCRPPLKGEVGYCRP